MLKSLVKKIFPLLLLLAFVLPLTAQAAFVECGTNCKLSDLWGVIIKIFNWLLTLAGLIAFLFLVWGAIQMVYGWLAEEPEHTFHEGMLTVRRAIWGLVLIGGAYLVINTLLFVLTGTQTDLNTFFQQFI